LRKKFANEEERIAHKKAYMKEYRQKNKEKLYAVDKAKTQLRRKTNKAKGVAYLGGSCKHCGLTTPHLCVYDFHHVNKSEKEADPGSLLHYSWKRIQKELDKCILLCANCHRIEHEKENNV
jgi:5-methylcytosine-specific restriction endonuclease McrA